DGCYQQSRPRSNAPFTPRIVLLGPPGSGKSLQAALLSQKYGLANIFFGDLLREKMAGNMGVGEFIKPFFERDCPVNDTIALHVLQERLEQADCRTYGWVLHGFPRDVDQALLFRQMGVKPNRVFFLNLPTEVGLQRLCQRATDPATGERYHTMYKPPVEEEVHQRLRHGQIKIFCFNMEAISASCLRNALPQVSHRARLPHVAALGAYLC
uniref:Adenylate kinase 8 n=1 Tax=Naja naja TaxID=35670 RepID=A0A8C6YDM7_NAJNA